MKRWVVLCVSLFLLACLVPRSSTRPDPVQSILGLPGGVDGVVKAIGGMCAAALAVMSVVWVSRKCNPKR